MNKNSSKTSSSSKKPLSNAKNIPEKKSTQNSKINNSSNSKITETISTSSNNIIDKKDLLKIDFKLLQHSSILTNQKVDAYLYLELMNNLDAKDDVKSLAICRLILAQDPKNEKIKELNDLLYESIKENYKKTGKLESDNNIEMNKHMKLNKDGEYEYYSSGEETD
jgi:hypothetical protein